MAGSRALGPGRRSGAFPGAPPSPEDGLSLEVLQQALRTVQTPSQHSPAARQRGVQALERACANRTGTRPVRGGFEGAERPAL